MQAKRTMRRPGTAVLKGLGAPAKAGIQKIHHSPELTILNVVWAPYVYGGDFFGAERSEWEPETLAVAAL